MYNTDEITLIKSVKDPTFGSETTSTSVIKCRIEDTNRLIRDANGKNVEASSLIMMPPGTNVVKGDRLIIRKKYFTLTGDTREYEVIETFKAGGFAASHIEVYI